MKELIPGTLAAQKAGCLCPVIDNAYGKGYLGMDGVYVYNEECPIHSLSEPLHSLDCCCNDCTWEEIQLGIDSEMGG
jgi:hypothetical protein